MKTQSIALLIVPMVLLSHFEFSVAQYYGSAYHPCSGWHGEHCYHGLASDFCTNDDAKTNCEFTPGCLYREEGGPGPEAESAEQSHCCYGFPDCCAEDDPGEACDAEYSRTREPTPSPSLLPAMSLTTLKPPSNNATNMNFTTETISNATTARNSSVWIDDDADN